MSAITACQNESTSIKRESCVFSQEQHVWLGSLRERRDVCRRERRLHLHLQRRLGGIHLRTEYVAVRADVHVVNDGRWRWSFVWSLSDFSSLLLSAKLESSLKSALFVVSDFGRNWNLKVTDCRFFFSSLSLLQTLMTVIHIPGKTSCHYDAKTF